MRGATIAWASLSRGHLESGVNQLPGEPAVVETTVNRVSAMTLVIPIKQELVPPLVFGLPPRIDPTAPPVRPLENLLTAFAVVQQLNATRTPMGLNEVATIHFARWVIINEGQDLLFCANFDTSLDQYLTDFMVIANTKRSPFMDLIWSNCVDYPGSEPTAFIAWARRWMVPTALFFPTISDVTVRDIDWLRQFKHFHDDFDRLAQEIPAEEWPPALRRAYEAFKRRVNSIDLAVVL
jgi:hypothetical protein